MQLDPLLRGVDLLFRSNGPDQGSLLEQAVALAGVTVLPLLSDEAPPLQAIAEALGDRVQA